MIYLFVLSLLFTLYMAFLTVARPTRWQSVNLGRLALTLVSAAVTVFAFTNL